MVAPDRERMRAALQRRQQQVADRLASPPIDVTLPVSRAELRDYLRRRLEVERVVRPVVELPAGGDLETPHGVCWRREVRYGLEHRHGEIALGEAMQLDGERLAAIAKSEQFAALDPRQCLFLDTETTGLSGGAGTVVFALGLGWFEDDAFVFEQLFLRDFGEEPAMLARLAERLGERPVPVTFVGKSFDRHRLAARLAVCRLSAPILTERHLDLYHVSRRVYGKQLPDCRLRTLETEVLGLDRHGDLPGSEAPIAFLQWIRDRSGPVDLVLEHNRLDVLSVAALLGVLAGAR